MIINLHLVSIFQIISSTLKDDKCALMDKEMDKMVKESHNPYLEGKRLPTVAKKGIMKRGG